VVAFALGELGLRPAEFWDLTFSEYLCMAEGYHRRQVLDWHHTRWLGTILLNVNRGEDDAPLTPEEVKWLPGDKIPGLISPEELDAELARVAAIDTDWL
jgi:hypothetical protein